LDYSEQQQFAAENITSGGLLSQFTWELLMLTKQGQ
jgi:hypothetical protein